MSKSVENVDVILIGGGIMSATLGALLHELDPNLHIKIFERLDNVAEESSNAWNNAGTGHSAFCELNYTPVLPDGSIAIDKAIAIGESFEVSRQFWAYLVKEKYLPQPQTFINTVPHMSFVHEKTSLAILRKKYDIMRKQTLFSDMQYTESSSTLIKWIPLVMQQRNSHEFVAATRMEIGTDVDFGALTSGIFTHLQKTKHVFLHTGHEVTDVQRNKKNGWNVFVTNTKTQERKVVSSRFVFIGAGGRALTLLQKSGIVEGRGYGGFPVNGNFLICTNREIINKHHAKVYGMPAVGTPPMSVPHLDTRIINGEKELLFGPYAGFSTKFLKHGSYFDLPLSITPFNLIPLLSAGAKNIPLTQYLIQQVLLSPGQRRQALQEYFPGGKETDWKLVTAGQRVQIIKYVPGKGGVLEFGTEVVSAADGSLAALLGASPGASVAVSIMLTLLAKSFPNNMKSKTWQKKLQKMIPSFGKKVGSDKKFCKEIREYTRSILQLTK